MPLIDFAKLVKSFRYAGRGFWYTIKNEQNIRLHLLISLVVIILMVYFEVALWQVVTLLMVMMFVLVLELINTIFEKVSDILRPRIHMYVEVIKDVMAAAVLVASIGAVVIGILIFIPYFVSG
ncbi:MAG: diacylglycerol kinase family protein [Patescibacteria group bacterium]